MMMKLAKRIEELALSPTVKLADRVTELEQQGRKIIRAETGQSFLPTPLGIRKAAITALENNQTYYGHSRGLKALRSAICEEANRGSGANLDPDANVLVTPGCKQALLYLILSIIEPGDEVIIPTPAWPSYGQLVRLAGGVPRFIDCAPDFLPAIDVVSASCNDRTKAIVICSPSNPTGRVIDRTTMSALHDLCKRKELLLISDEIYAKIVFEECVFATLLDFDHTLSNSVVINGFSKAFAMPGWRIGYALAAKKLIDGMLKIQQNTVTCPTTFGQYGALEALRIQDTFLGEINNLYRFNMKQIQKCLSASKVFAMVPPGGGMYAFVDIRKTGKTSADFCLELLDRYDIAISAGSAFGPGGEGFVRICLGIEKDKMSVLANRLVEAYG